MGLCQMLTKGHSMYNGKKLLQLRVSGIHISSHHCKPPFFFGSRPPLDIFWRAVYNYFSTLFILAFGRSYDVKNLLKFIIMLLRKIEKTLRKISQWKSWKSALEKSGRLHFPLPKYERTPFCYLIFCFAPSPASCENANNSHLILFHILLVRNILRQRGRFICERFSFAFYYLLYYIVNSKVLLFANNYHLHCIRIWISFAFANNSHLNIIIVWIS